MGGQILIIGEMIMFFGGLIAFGVWQQRLMRRDLDAAKAEEE